MVQAVGFPTVAKQTIPPGQAFVTAVDGMTLYCVQGQHRHFALLGHDRPPCALWKAIDGPIIVFPGEVQVRPIRDRPWNMSWRTSPRPGDLVISAQGVFMSVEDRHPKGSEFSPSTMLLDLATGRSPVGTVSGPIFQGWELVCFPLPNRPVFLGRYEPRDHGEGRRSA